MVEIALAAIAVILFAKFWPKLSLRILVDTLETAAIFGLAIFAQPHLPAFAARLGDYRIPVTAFVVLLMLYTCIALLAGLYALAVAKSKNWSDYYLIYVISSTLIEVLFITFFQKPFFAPFFAFPFWATVSVAAHTPWLLAAFAILWTLWFLTVTTLKHYREGQRP